MLSGIEWMVWLEERLIQSIWTYCLATSLEDVFGSDLIEQEQPIGHEASVWLWGDESIDCHSFAFTLGSRIKVQAKKKQM